MKRYEIEFARYYKVEILADDKKAAEEIAAIMEDEVIESGEKGDFDIWNIKEME